MNPAIPIATAAALALAASARRRGSAQLDAATLAMFKEKAGELIRASGVAGLNQAREVWVSMVGENVPLDLSGADLSTAGLIRVDLSGADLSGAKLTEAELLGANLRGANLSGANLEGADMRMADLAEARLNNASVRGANLSQANLKGADLTDIWWEPFDLDPGHCEPADDPGRTVWPIGFIP